VRGHPVYPGRQRDRDCRRPGIVRIRSVCACDPAANGTAGNGTPAGCTVGRSYRRDGDATARCAGAGVESFHRPAARHAPRTVMRRPGELLVVAGTGTEIGKTWAAQRLLLQARERGLRVAARKPAQSFVAGEQSTDAELLAAASGEAAEEVCPRHRWYPVPMAPPMAADVLG